MLKYCDSFDHVTLSALPALGWTIDMPEYTALISAGKGRWGTNRLDFPKTAYSYYNPKYFTLSRSCDRIVVGFAFTRDPSYEGNSFTVGFAYGTFENFRVTVTLSTTGLTFSFMTGTGTGYPVILDSAYVSAPFIQSDAFTFIEILVDVANYKNGQVKCGVNGVVVHNVTGIITAAYNGFGDNPFDPRAKINTVRFGRTTQYCFLNLDSIYICDDEGAYHNDFLGDIFVKTIYPAIDGDQVTWSPYINGLSAPENTQRVSLIDDPEFNPVVEPDYIQASQDLSQETMWFNADMPADSTLIAVNHRTAARTVASPGTPPANALIPLFKSSGNDIIVTNSLAKKFTGWTYQFLDVYYNLVPGLTVDWTELLLAGSQFGFMLRESIWTVVQLEEINFADEVIDE